MSATERERFERVRRHLELRAAMLASVRQFFAARGYLEVDTPVMVPSPGLDLHLDAFQVEDAYLTTSPELQMKRLLCGGLDGIYQLARCFRRGERGSLHNPEFLMLEWYRAGASLDDLMDETEALVRSLLPAHDRDFLRMTVAEAFERYAGIDENEMLRLAEHDEDRYFLTLVDRIEPAFAALDRPVMLHAYPASQASLARRMPARPDLCERFELYVGAIELCNGFGELTDPAEQRARFERDQARRRQQNKPVYPIDERFLAALAEGMPACAGNALGFDRLVALAAGVTDIADVMPFPHDHLV